MKLINGKHLGHHYLIQIENDVAANSMLALDAVIFVDGQPISSDPLYTVCLRAILQTNEQNLIKVATNYIEKKDFVFRSGVSESFALMGFNDVLYANPNGFDRKRQLEWFIELIKNGSNPQPGPFLLVCVTTIDYMGGVAEGFTDVNGEDNSQARFRLACRKIIGFTDLETEMLLNSIRNPMVHAGITEGLIGFGAEINEQEEAIAVPTNTGLNLYVGSVALRVLAGIEKMAKSPKEWIRDRPGEGSNRKWDKAHPYQTKAGAAISLLREELLKSV